MSRRPEETANGKNDLRPLPAVLARVETCEREHVRLKRIGAVVLLVAAAGLLCALSAGGQQQDKSGNTNACELGDNLEPNCHETLVRARPSEESQTDYVAPVTGHFCKPKSTLWKSKPDSAKEWPTSRTRNSSKSTISLTAYER